MSNSLRAFKREIYREHLEEASFLYEQRLALMANPETHWTRIRDFEMRLEAHIDALVVGDSLALDVCRARLVDGDAGELFAALCVVCRQRQASILNDLWRSFGQADSAKIRAVTDALKLEMPLAWHGFCDRAIGRRAPTVSPVLSEVCGYRRMPLGEEIAQALLATPGHRQSGALWALSRLPASESTLAALKISLQNQHADVRAAAVLGLLWKASPLAIQACHRWLADEDWPSFYLALAGNRSVLDALRGQLAAGRGTALTLRAVGLLGDLSAVRPLCDYLGDHELADAAAWALYWIIGAPLLENAFVEEAIDESELFDAERRALRERGKKPMRGDGKPFGRAIRRLSHDRSHWEHWLSNNKGQFDPRFRYRFGRLYSPMTVIRGLTETSAPQAMRQWSYEELSIQFSCPVTFEADWRVDDQLRALKSMSAWAGANTNRFSVGAWH